MEWISENTELVSAIIGLITGVLSGGAIGYRIGINKSVNQKQEAGNNANQSQIGNNYVGRR